MGDILQMLMPEQISSEGFTPSLLQQYADRLAMRAVKVREAICERALLDVEHAKQHATCNDDGATHHDDPQRLLYLEGLKAVHASSDADGAFTAEDQQLATCAADFRHASRALHQTTRALQALHAAHSWQQQLAHVDALMHIAHYGEAAVAVEELGRISHVLTGPEWESLTTLQQHRKAALQAALLHAVQDGIHIQPGMVTPPHPHTLEHVWQGVRALHMTHKVLPDLATRLHQCMFQPLLLTHRQHQQPHSTQHPHVVPHVVLLQSEQHGPCLQLVTPKREESDDTGQHPTTRPHDAVDQDVLVCLTYCRDVLMVGDDTLARALGGVLWPMVAAEYAACVLVGGDTGGGGDGDATHTATPATTTTISVDVIQQTAARAVALEQHVAMQLGMWPPSSDDDDDAHHTAHDAAPAAAAGSSLASQTSVNTDNNHDDNDHAADTTTTSQHDQRNTTAQGGKNHAQETQGGGPLTAAAKSSVDRVVHGRRAQVVARARALLKGAPVGASITVGTPLPPPQHPVPPPPPITPGKAGPPPPPPPPAEQLDWGSPGEEGPVTATGCFAIAPVMQEVVELLHDAMQQGVESHSVASAQSMCAAVMDVATLVVTLPTVLQGRALHQVPHLAALHHNNCQYLATCIALLPEQSQPALGNLLPQPPCFVECAFSVRAAGRAALKTCIELQLQELYQVLQAAGGFTRLRDAARGIAVRRALQQVLQGFRQLGGALSGVLSQRDLVAVASLVLSGVCGRIAGDVLDMHDISAAEADDLARIVEPFVEGAPGALLRGAHGTDTPGALPMEQLIAALQWRTSAYRRLQAIVKLLGASLADIERYWLDGVLQQDGLDKDDVQQLVQALFEHTDARSRVLAVVDAHD